MEPTAWRSFLPSRTKTGSTSCAAARCVSRTRFRSAAVRRSRRGRYCGKLDTLILVAVLEVWLVDGAPPGDSIRLVNESRPQAPHRWTLGNRNPEAAIHALCAYRSRQPAYHIM